MLPLTLANLKMMARNRQTTFWALFFPLTLVVVFGLFDGFGDRPATLEVVDLAQSNASAVLVEELSGLNSLQVIASRDPAGTRARLAAGGLDYFLTIPAGYGVGAAGGVEESGPGGDRVALVHGSRDREQNQLVAGAVGNIVASAGTSVPALEVGEIESEREPYAGSSYFDVALLGLVCLGVMANSIISIAVKISVYRNQSILKRMLVTPLAIWKYFAAEVAAHLVLAVMQAGIILGVGVFVFGAEIHGNLGWMMLLVVLGSVVFLNIGFILSAWANTPSAASSMGNIIVLPMIFLAGTFFSTASLPWLLPYAAEVLPLTPMLSALRDIGIDNASLVQVWPQLAALGGWIVITSVAAIRVFRFS